MVILWGKDLLSLNYSFKGGGFVGVNPDWKGGTYNFINIYASCNMVRRRNLWKALIQLKRKILNEDWCLWGDFNTVSGKEGHIGIRVSYKGSEWEEFKDFIEDMELLDLPNIGGHFTWYNETWNAMSRLDRFLLSIYLVSIWKTTG
ncbi:unnamed protein product [Lathyrus oleraceus]